MSLSFANYHETFSHPALPEKRTALPGPKAKELVSRDHSVLSPSYTRDYPLAVQRASGLGLEDVDGNWFLDFTAGIAVTNIGHCHPHVVQKIQAQSSKLLHMSGTDFYYEPMVQLAERLTKLAPGPSSKTVFFTNSGTEAVEAAIKLSRYHTKRTRLIAFFGAFHGRTYGAMSLTASKVQQRRGFTPLLPEVHHVPYGDLEALEYLFKKTVPPEEVAAIFVEPVQGEGGYLTAPEGFLTGLRSLCDRHGILLVADEVQCGMGRTGKLFAQEHWDVQADITCLAKGIASGMPLGAIIARQDVMTWKPGSHGSTFAGNPVACEAANATLDVLLEPGNLTWVTERSTQLKKNLQEVSLQHPSVTKVRGLGLMVAADICDASGQPDPKKRDAIVLQAYQEGLLLLPCAEAAIRFSPALCLSAEHVNLCTRLFAAAVGAVK